MLTFVLGFVLGAVTVIAIVLLTITVVYQHEQRDHRLEHIA